jgi:DNA polymerase I-like protein with 3'-5' exonuclease and polymerase domains
MPVHDEVTGDFDATYSERLAEFFNQQDFELKVPLQWELGFGANWREAK